MTHPAQLQAATYDVADAFEANEFYQEQGWTDGLPIVPPTAERVAAFLEAAGLDADDVVGVEGVRQRPLTAEKVAINAVMAGCRPDYMPVVVAVLRAMCQERFNMHGSTASTGGSAPFIVVNGPVRGAIGMNATHNVLANGNRANATIGRTVRLVLVNLLGCIPGQLDRSTLGHPGKFAFCIAEDEEDSPWLPLAQERGVPAGESAVTVMSVAPPRQIMNEWTHDPEEILDTFAAEMRHNMLTYSVWSGSYFLVITKQLREVARCRWLAEKRRPRVHFPCRAGVSAAMGNGRQGQYRQPQRRTRPGIHRPAQRRRPARGGGRRPGRRVRQRHPAVARRQSAGRYAND